MVANHLSRINYGKSEELPINDYFPYDRFVAFVRFKVHCYAYLTDFLVEGSSNIKKELKEVATIAKSTILWYAYYINYLVVGVLPPELRFDTLILVISDSESLFISKCFENLLIKYGLKQRVATSYHPQTSEHVEIPSREIK